MPQVSSIGPPPAGGSSGELMYLSMCTAIGLTMATEDAIHNKFMKKRPEERRVNGNRVIKSNLVRGACIVTAAAVGISVGAIGIPVLTTFVTSTCWCYGFMITTTGVINTTKWLFTNEPVRATGPCGGSNTHQQ